MERRPWILVTSVVCVPQLPLSYAACRSAWTAQERLDQTLNTVRTCRGHFPEAHIAVLDGSEALPDAWQDVLRAAADELWRVDFQRSPEALACAHSPFKAVFENYKLAAFMEDHRAQWTAMRNIYKISGRYWLNESFQKDAWEGHDAPMCRRFADGTRCTAFFKMAGGTEGSLQFLEELRAVRHDLERGESVENVLFTKHVVEPTVRLVPHIGLNGFIAIHRHECVSF